VVTKRELTAALRIRYHKAEREKKQAILDEFVEISGYHRKHAIRLLSKPAASDRQPRQAGKRIYDEAVSTALVILWEAADRICGKRLKVLLPILIDAMERHGRLQLDAAVRRRLLTISAATIDRALTRFGRQGLNTEAVRQLLCERRFRCARLVTGRIRRRGTWKPISFVTAGR
jgi:hypothetical protein